MNPRNEKCKRCGHKRHEHFDNVGNDTRCIHHNDEHPVLFCPCPAFIRIEVGHPTVEAYSSVVATPISAR